MSEALWTPPTERVAASNIERFRMLAEHAAAVDIPDTTALHTWSVENMDAFWSLFWEDAGVIGDPGSVAFAPGDDMVSARFFPGASLSVAENIIEGGDRPDDEVAIAYRREDGMARDVTRAELRSEAAAFAAALQVAGVRSGDRVAAWMPNVPETVIAMLGTNSIGGVFASTSSDFGTAGVVDRFGQVEPKVLVAGNGYRYGGNVFDRLGQLDEIRALLPSVELVVIVDTLGSGRVAEGDGIVSYPSFIGMHLGTEASYERLPFDHPMYILYSSGTTGKPKCIVHRGGGVLLKHIQEQLHHLDARPGDRLFYFTTCGWMMWNWLVSGMAVGASIVLFDGNPFHPGPEALFDLADELEFTVLGVSAKYIDSVYKSGVRPVDTHSLASIRTICSTGSPLSPEGFSFVYDGIKADVHLSSISGGTDLCGCFVTGDPTRPVYAGEIQGPALATAVAVFDEDGSPLASAQGELVCTAPFPSMPITFWGDDGDRRYRAAYFERFPGVWTHGDFARWTEHGGMVILGRSDATLNSGGVRIGTAEIYRIVERFDEVAEAIAVAQRHDHDTRVVLFVRMSEGHELTDELRDRIKHRLRTEESPRHVPALISAVDDIPRTRSGKISELAVTAAINGDPIKNTEALANAEALELYRNLPELA